MSATKLFSPLLIPQTVRKKATASVIFLHGSGDTNMGILSWVGDLMEGEFSFPHIQTVFPTAPVRPYTPFGGMPSSVWFDRMAITPQCAEHESVDQMCDQLSHLIKDQQDKGIPINRIVLGGFSMGGAMALHLAFRRFREVAGVFALSGFLNQDSAVYKLIEKEPGPLPALFQGHGGKDSLVRLQWGHETFNKLKSLNVKGEFHKYPELTHEMSTDELCQLKDWISGILPDVDLDGMFYKGYAL
ncbi:lysophospholipase-like protein 1 [Liolophura sinensis]|uniref:lysophospholipase-like protein 1 n=1 Tax=Liolophura sinensis TaxID=3198878 RepID=UPI0031587F3C